MKVKPLEDRVLVKPEEAEQKTSAGIYLPESAQSKPTQGKVVAVGPGKVNDEGEHTKPEVKKGDKVIYGKFAGNEIDVDGEPHVLLRESELLAVIQS